LDETLIHSQQIIPNSDQEIVKDFEIVLANNVRFGVAVRPYVQQCLEHLSNYYEMAVFTAAEQTYADLIIDKIDPEKKFFSQRLYRQHCFKIEDVYVKDLRIISDRATEDTIIVDNSILSFAFQLDNGVPMCAFLATNNQDQELLYLITYLEEVYHLKDCRTANKKTFKLSEMMAKIN
jgi:CTD small phosphatase-like protein 2